MKVYATIHQQVEVDPIDVIKEINIIPKGDWIVVKKSLKGEKIYVQMTEESAGSHSFDREVGEVSKKVYDLYMAPKLLINYLEEKKKQR